MIEHFFTCPYCWQTISMLLDPDMSQEEYIEDCQVCCNPILLSFVMSDGVLINFRSQRAS